MLPPSTVGASFASPQNVRPPFLPLNSRTLAQSSTASVLFGRAIDSVDLKVKPKAVGVSFSPERAEGMGLGGVAVTIPRAVNNTTIPGGIAKHMIALNPVVDSVKMPLFLAKTPADRAKIRAGATEDRYYETGLEVKIKGPKKIESFKLLQRFEPENQTWAWAIYNETFSKFPNLYFNKKDLPNPKGYEDPGFQAPILYAKAWKEMQAQINRLSAFQKLDFDPAKLPPSKRKEMTNLAKNLIKMEGTQDPVLMIPPDGIDFIVAHDWPMGFSLEMLKDSKKQARIAMFHNSYDKVKLQTDAVKLGVERNLFSIDPRMEHGKALPDLISGLASGLKFADAVIIDANYQRTHTDRWDWEHHVKSPQVPLWYGPLEKLVSGKKSYTVQHAANKMFMPFKNHDVLDYTDKDTGARFVSLKTQPDQTYIDPGFKPRINNEEDRVKKLRIQELNEKISYWEIPKGTRNFILKLWDMAWTPLRNRYLSAYQLERSQLRSELKAKYAVQEPKTLYTGRKEYAKFKYDNKIALQTFFSKEKDKVTGTLTVDPQARVYAWASRFEPYQKGFFTMIHAFNEFMSKPGNEHVQLIVAGTPPDDEAALGKAKAEMFQIARRFPGRVVFPGNLAPNDLARAYAGADFLMMPSRYEPYGQSQLEGMALGAIPIAHYVDGLASTLNDPEMAENLPPEKLEIYNNAVRPDPKWGQTAIGYIVSNKVHAEEASRRWVQGWGTPENVEMLEEERRDLLRALDRSTDLAEKPEKMLDVRLNAYRYTQHNNWAEVSKAHHIALDNVLREVNPEKYGTTKGTAKASKKSRIKPENPTVELKPAHSKTTKDTVSAKLEDVKGKNGHPVIAGKKSRLTATLT